MSATRHHLHRWARTFVLAGAMATALMAAGCEYDDDDDNDHEPPAGQGSLIIYNNTVDDIAVYIDDVRVDDVGDDNDRAYDLAPGVHRVVLDQRGGDRTFRDDIDILEGRRTVMDVTTDPLDAFEYDVVIFFD
jgi:hypothetical protein